MDKTTNNHFNNFITKGSLVEVTSDINTGAWFSATVIHPPHAPNNLVYVEYHTLLTDNGTSRLREYANVDSVRPSPPPLPLVDGSGFVKFEVDDLVDVFYRDGWWTGVVTRVVDEINFVVRFVNDVDLKEVEVNLKDLRVHRKWVDDQWLLSPKQSTAGLMFTVGKKVEVSFDKENLREVWFPATVLKNSGDNTFLVEYQQPGSGDEAVLHKVTVDQSHIRPSPPHLRDKNFVLLEKVDAYYDYGWWSGVITKELADNRYNVYFKHTKKDREVICSNVRPHIEWKGGKWFNTSQIEQSTPSDGKQSTVATSALKRTKQTNLDSDDNNSSPSKKSKDEAHLDDSSKRINGASAGQSEGLDSEFGKTENLSHGKKVRGKRGKGIEQAPAMESSKKKGRLANEPKSLNLDEGATDDSVKTTSQEITEKDVTKDMALPVVMGLQCNEMTVTQGKIIQKSSTEISPSVAEGDANQLDVLSAPSTAVVKEGKEEDAATVAPKRKRGRPPKLQPKSPETPVTVEYHQNGGVVPAEISVVEGAQVMEVSSPTSPGIKLVENSQEPAKEPNENPEQDASAQGGKKKYSSAKGRRGKRRTISVNESLAQDIQDASKEKTDGSLETNDPEASAVQPEDLDDQPLSTWIEGVHSPVPFNGPVGTSTKSERQLEIVACDIDADIPFVKTTPLWHTIESMEAFRKLPQNPHFRPLLKGVKESAREGLAIGTMVTFSTVVDRTYCLRSDDPRSAIEDSLETLVDLESNGFDVEAIRERLTRLLLIKDKQEELEDQSKVFVEKIEEQKIPEKTFDDELDEIDRQIRQLEEKRSKVLLKKENSSLEVGALKASKEAIEQELLEVGAEFDGLAAAPF